MAGLGVLISGLGDRVNVNDQDDAIKKVETRSIGESNTGRGGNANLNFLQEYESDQDDPEKLEVPAFPSPSTSGLSEFSTAETPEQLEKVCDTGNQFPSSAATLRFLTTVHMSLLQKQRTHEAQGYGGVSPTRESALVFTTTSTEGAAAAQKAVMESEIMMIEPAGPAVASVGSAAAAPEPAANDVSDEIVPFIFMNFYFGARTLRYARAGGNIQASAPASSIAGAEAQAVVMEIAPAVASAGPAAAAPGPAANDVSDEIVIFCFHEFLFWCANS